MDDAAALQETIDRMAQVTVVLYGDLVLDRFILGTPKRLSREAPIIILRYEGQSDIPGGAANALANLAALDVRPLPVGAVGDDEPGRTLLGILQDRGIDTSYILTVPDYRTPTKVRLLGGGPSSLKHQVARYDIEGELPPDGGWRQQMLDNLAASASHSDVVAISDYGYGAVLAEAPAALRSVASPPSWLCLDSRYRLAELRSVDAATPNLGELEACAGRSLATDADVESAAEDLRRHLGARFLLATRGNRGMTMVDGQAPPLHLPVHGTDEVADVTGAGDTVLAVLAASLAAGATPRQAAFLSNLGGGTVVMKLGTATVSREELRLAAALSTAGVAEC